MLVDKRIGSGRSPGLGPDFDLSEQRLVSCLAGNCDGYRTRGVMEYVLGEGEVP